MKTNRTVTESELSGLPRPVYIYKQMQQNYRP